MDTGLITLFWQPLWYRLRSFLWLPGTPLIWSRSASPLGSRSATETNGQFQRSDPLSMAGEKNT